MQDINCFKGGGKKEFNGFEIPFVYEIGDVKLNAAISLSLQATISSDFRILTLFKLEYAQE